MDALKPYYIYLQSFRYRMYSLVDENIIPQAQINTMPQNNTSDAILTTDVTSNDTYVLSSDQLNKRKCYTSPQLQRRDCRMTLINKKKELNPNPKEQSQQNIEEMKLSERYGYLKKVQKKAK